MKTEIEIEKTIKSSPKVVGTKQVLRSIASEELRCVVIAEDADEALKSKLIEASTKSKIDVHFAQSMKWLGTACEIAVGAAVVGILKI